MRQRAIERIPSDGGSRGADARLFRLGYEVLGPAFTYFTLRLERRVAELDLDAVYFVARDGFLLQQLYEVVGDHRRAHRGTAQRYLYLSRLSTALPSVRRFGLRELRLGAPPPERRSILSALRAFGLADAEVVEALRRAGVDQPSRPLGDCWRDPDVRRILDDDPFQQLVSERAHEARARLRRYLAEEGWFDHRRIALVDIGWNGTIQNNLERAFFSTVQWPLVRGLYFGLVDDRWLKVDGRTSARMEGLVADWRRPAGSGERAPFHFLEIFEQASRARHGTTLGYEERGGRMAPRLQHDDGTRLADADASAVTDLQRGILGFAGSRRWSVDEANDAMRADVHRRLGRFIFRPTHEELSAVGAVVHADDWGAGRRRPLIIEEPRALTARDWLASYRAAPWKPGLLHATAGPWAARLYQAWMRLGG
jgi:hypothetical protein